MATIKTYANSSLLTNQALQLYNTADTFFVSLKAPSAQGANFALVLPGSDTTNGVISSNGSGVLSLALIVDANVAAAAAIAVTKLAALTASRAVVSDASGFLTVSATTSTEIGFVSGVTSAIQTQLNGKASTALSNLTVSGLTTDDLLYASSSSALTRLGIGTNGQILTVVSGAPAWAAAPAASAPSSQDLITNYSVANSTSLSALTITLNDATGATPSAGSAVTIPFRSGTLATGTYTAVTVTASLTLTVASLTTLGLISGQDCYVYLYALNNGGTAELAVIAGIPVDEQLLQTTTAISGGNTINTLYSTTARTNKAVRYLGRLLLNETVAGTWASVATEISINRLQASISGIAAASFDSSAGLLPPRTKQITLSVSGNHSWSTSRAVGIIYNDGAGVWRIKFNIDGTTASNAQTSITISGITFNEASAVAIVTNQTANGSFSGAQADSGGGTIDMFSGSSSTTGWRVAGDVELTGQPTI